MDATRVARGPGGFLYRVDPPPEATLVEDAPAWLSVGERAFDGRLGVGRRRELPGRGRPRTSGPRVLDGRLVVDNLGPLRGLRQRLTALEGEQPRPPTFRFDQAEFVLGTPGGRLNDAIAEAASDATDEWSYDDRDRRRAAQRAAAALGAGAHPARHGRPAASSRGCWTGCWPWTPGCCSWRRPAPSWTVRSGRCAIGWPGPAGCGPGMVQRIGPLAPGAVRDRWGPFVEPATIAADLRAGVDARLSDLDRAEGRMRYDELDRAAGAAGPGRGRAGQPSWSGRVGARRGRRDRDLDPDTLVVRRHELRSRSSARPGATPTGSPCELAADDRPVPTVEDVVGPGGRSDEQRRRLAAARRELVAARDDVEPALRARVRLAAATTRGAYLRGLPRADVRRGRDRRARRWRRRRTTSPGCRPAA